MGGQFARSHFAPVGVGYGPDSNGVVDWGGSEVCDFGVGGECFGGCPGPLFHPEEGDGLAAVTIMLLRFDVALGAPEWVEDSDERGSLAWEIMNIQ